MKIIVLNGSPKGDMSVTLQSVYFIEKKFPAHDFEVLHISRDIKKIENDDGRFRDTVEIIEACDAVLWAFPLYVFLVPSQYKRFIELIFEKRAESAFRKKYTAALSTSIHFFDHAAHNYVHAVCDDLEMKYTGFFSMDMYDLLKKEERKRLELFAENFFEAVEKKSIAARVHPPLVFRDFQYIPGAPEEKIDPGNKKIVILSDSSKNPSNIAGMVERFASSFSKRPEIVDLSRVDMTGGCTGCIHCGYENVCRYRDGFTEFFNTIMTTADIVVFAGSIEDRYLSSLWKMYLDRSFFANHAPAMRGKQLGVLVSGPLSRMDNLKQILDALAEWQQMNLAGTVTDEYGNSSDIDALLQDLAERLVLFSRKNYFRPQTFLGAGGMKVFRDAVWGTHRAVFQSDHRYFKRRGIYDFPQKDWKSRWKNAWLILLTKIPAYRKVFLKKLIKPKMIEPHRKVLKKTSSDK